MKKLRKLLLIDDEIVSRSLNRMVIEELNLVEEIVQSDNGLAALTRLAEETLQGLPFPDVILLDLYMPVMNGVTFLQHLTDHNGLSSLLERTVVFTSSGNGRDIEQIKQIGVRWYLDKPLTREKIFPALITLIGERQRSAYQ